MFSRVPNGKAGPDPDVWGAPSCGAVQADPTREPREPRGGQAVTPRRAVLHHVPTCRASPGGGGAGPEATQ